MAWRGPSLVRSAVLPVTFADAPARLRDALDAVEPDLVVCTGLAAGTAEIAVERFAVNLIDAPAPDEAGAMPTDQPVMPGAEQGLISSLPVKAITRALREAGIPASLSMSAGTFVCNQVFYTALEWSRSRPGTRAGFIHVPWADGQAPSGQPSMSLHRITRAVEIAVHTAVQTAVDIDVPGGGTH